MNKILRLYNTVRYLKIRQIYFRLFYLVRNKYRQKVGYKYPSFQNKQSFKLKYIDSIPSYTSYENRSFTFLNITKQFETQINWNFDKYGKLWTYNLTYFDFLNQKTIDTFIALDLINDFIGQEKSLKDALEPFPISLRNINWIKFLSKNDINNNEINQILYKHYMILMDNLEYHLLGNHLLENGFSLLFGAYYFKDETLYFTAKKILKAELDEQILADGAHFELTPMYHQIMLFRLLDCINLVKSNDFQQQELLEFLTIKASLMLGWLHNITFSNGSIPLLNDSTNNIAPISSSLFDYAKRLNIESRIVRMKESGYRKIVNEQYECILDIGNIGPDYIPGHAHSDTFNFELNINNKPFIVDTGVSTYESNQRRLTERSTSSHNTVEVNKKEQSEMWGGFRVAKRAKIIYINEKDNIIEATHDGYKEINILHTRQWRFEKSKIIITDKLNKEASSIARLHFHPSISKEEVLKTIKIANGDLIFFNYTYSSEFNKQITALGIEIPFKKEINLEINI